MTIAQDLITNIEQVECLYSRMFALVETSDLMSTDPAPYVEALLRMVQENPTALLRHQALLALQAIDAKTHPKEAIRSLVALKRGASDPDPSVRYAAAFGLGRAVAWASLASYSPWSGREAFAKTKSQIVFLLGNLARDPVEHIRLMALMSLGEIGRDGIEPGLKDLINTIARDQVNPPAVRKAAFSIRWAINNAEAAAAVPPAADKALRVNLQVPIKQP